MITQVTDVNHVLLEGCHCAPRVPALALVQPRTPGWWRAAAAAIEISLTPLQIACATRIVGREALGRVSLFGNKCQLGGLFV